MSKRSKFRSRHIYIESSFDSSEESQEYGFAEAGDDDNAPAAAAAPPLVEELEHDATRKLSIVTWGLKLHREPPVGVTFNLSRFCALAKDAKDAKDAKRKTGRDKDVQESVIRHPMFTQLLRRMVQEIEVGDLHNISMACNYGRHRSVAWAELLKQHCYPCSSLHHMGLEE